jgi:hypothetical protein
MTDHVALYPLETEWRLRCVPCLINGTHTDSEGREYARPLFALTQLPLVARYLEWANDYVLVVKGDHVTVQWDAGDDDGIIERHYPYVTVRDVTYVELDLEWLPVSLHDGYVVA